MTLIHGGMMLVQQYVFLDVDAVQALTPAQVETYLASKGWTKAETEPPGGQIWTRPDHEPLPPHLTALPEYKPHLVWRGYVKSLTSTRFRDYAARICELLLALALFEHRLVADVLADVRTLPATEKP
ncbi:hypothetical protein [Streptomyces lancefieldiae]|uniref:Uncharacterized protein n=1 Tax=Streptomyces lancefieldiae TaxID=3075520 RepID=A0ABU3B1T3_9ACTN|nr:hypothetical protein [Streptomyces sp. DSM 40712]MDT0616406.1 hypothetical protein [Streptomyces sp. DSM 40712]